MQDIGIPAPPSRVATARSISIPIPVRNQLKIMAERLSLVRALVHEQPQDRVISLARLVELLYAHAVEHPMSAEFVQNFPFSFSRPLGRPRGNKLGSSIPPTVSEEQPSGRKDEDQRNQDAERDQAPCQPSDGSGPGYAW